MKFRAKKIKSGYIIQYKNLLFWKRHNFSIYIYKSTADKIVKDLEEFEKAGG